MYSRSISDSILILIIWGWGMKMVIDFMTWVINSLCFSFLWALNVKDTLTYFHDSYYRGVDNVLPFNSNFFVVLDFCLCFAFSCPLRCFNRHKVALLVLVAELKVDRTFLILLKLWSFHVFFHQNLHFWVAQKFQSLAKNAFNNVALVFDLRESQRIFIIKHAQNYSLNYVGSEKILLFREGWLKFNLSMME